MDVIEDSFPLSPLQQGMLFNGLYAPGSGVDIEQMECGLPEPLNVPAFIQAWQRVMERHASLRTAFRWQDADEPAKALVYRQVRVPFEFQDWRGLSGCEQAAHREAFLRADRLQGFRFQEAPLMRLTLIQLAEAEYSLIWTFHHAILDGRSFPLVLNEVFAFYEAEGFGQEPHLEQPRPYSDYIAWLKQQDLSQAKTFWRKRLQGFTAPTKLLIERPRPELDPRSSALLGHSHRQCRLSEALTASLQALAQAHDLTLNTFVQGAWALLLSRYSGEAEVVFGATRNGRRSALAGQGTEAMVGLLINTVPVRVAIPADISKLSWLKRLRGEWLAIRDYEHTPLVNIQEWSDVPKGTHLFDSLLMFENYQLTERLQAQGGAWQNRTFRLHEQTNYALTLTAYAGTSIELHLSYDRLRFEDDAIERMLGHLQTLLEGIQVDLDQPISAVSLLTEAERHQLLVTWNETRQVVPQDACIHHLFEAEARRRPDAVALIDGGRFITYHELNVRANQLAHHLQRLGVGADVLVGVSMERSLEMIVGLLGTLKAGGAYVPLDPAYPRERLAFMLADAGVKVLLTQARVTPSLPEHKGIVVLLDSSWEAMAAESTANPESTVTADNPAYVIYTSGSTGQPKGVEGLHRGAVNRFAWMWQTYPFAAGEVCCQKTSLNFLDSLWEIFGPLLKGTPIVMIPDEEIKDPALLVHTLAAHDVTRLVLVPSLLRVLLDTYPDLHSRLPRLKYWVSSGEVLPIDLYRRFVKLLPQSILLNLYGASEVSADATWYDTRQGVSGASVPIGRPIANNQVYILDGNLQPVPAGVPGELHIGGVGLARGYHNRPELTAEKFIPNPFTTEGAKLFPHSGTGDVRLPAPESGKDQQIVPQGTGDCINSSARLYKTGDLGRYRADGTIEYVGRSDRQVKIRGFRLELGEIEAALAEHPALRQVAVVARAGRPEALGDKQLVAYVVPNKDAHPTVTELRRFLKQTLPDYMIPAAFITTLSLSLSPSGKLDTAALPVPDPGRPELQEPFVAPRTPVEEVMAEIWADMLGLAEGIGVQDNFFELGGNSLLATRVMSRIYRTFQQDMPLRSLFETPTIAGLVETLINHEAVPGQIAAIARLRQRVKRMPADEVQALLQKKKQDRL